MYHPSYIYTEGLRANVSDLAPISDVAGTLFKCEDGTLIFPLSVCDGIPDCPDWSDETKCSGNTIRGSFKE